MVILMAYKVLYRKYRPDSFENLYGQEAIKKLLSESIVLNKVSHAYLFHGPRGTGKTSTAKIFAKAINCENNIDGNPCNKCNSCINLFNSNDNNIFAPDDKSPCAGKFLLNDGTEYDVSENDVVTYQQLYPGIDVMQELRNIQAWCLSNPKNRKTRSGAKRFLNSWLSRAQNSARPVHPPSDKKGNDFNNFNQREYDYDRLEGILLNTPVR